MLDVGCTNPDDTKKSPNVIAKKQGQVRLKDSLDRPFCSILAHIRLEDIPDRALRAADGASSSRPSSLVPPQQWQTMSS
jgi:hypothetical protein